MSEPLEMQSPGRTVAGGAGLCRPLRRWRRRAAAVAVITGVNYGSASGG
ncbi:peptidase [Escherichia coli]|nr:peptidase [Escherichia coli]MCW7229609.1 peptidase [Escherichia coli]